MIKRTFDIIAAVCGLVLLGPFFLVAAALVKFTSAGPVFFQQERIGREFRPFQILKFRTMVVNAPQLGGLLTAGNDKRITRIGRFLRATKFDELPQLINVLRGDMSLVGPRPEVRRYVELYRDDYAELLRVRPGITDLASLKYRHESQLLDAFADPDAAYVTELLPDKIALGREYIRRSSFWFDVSLIFKTVFRMAETAESIPDSR